VSDRDALGVKSALTLKAGSVEYYSLEKLEKTGYAGVGRMPRTVKILVESVIRQLDGETVTEDHLNTLLQWKEHKGGEFAFKPTRVLMQDFTGVPAVVDLAVMRDAMVDLGAEPQKINPLIPVDLVIDHSLQIDRFGSCTAFTYNAEREFERNRERYEILSWASKAFDNFTVVPPAMGICHQVNLEYLATVVRISSKDDGSREESSRSGDSRVGKKTAYPDTLVGTDSHTTMINGMGVLGWGVGGIEAEAAILGQPLYMPTPQVIGVRLFGRLATGVTATDLVLTVTQILREYGVVGRYVEFFGQGLDGLELPDRATISNMCPEYGATAALFPVDTVTLGYLRSTGRDPELVDLVERYTKAQGLFRTAESPDPDFTDTLDLDIGSVVPCIAGPSRPHDRIPLSDVKEAFGAFASAVGIPSESLGRSTVTGAGSSGHTERPVGSDVGKGAVLRLCENDVMLNHGSIVISAITSCTNTSNPSVLIAAGLVAKRAVERGLKVPGYVKTSLAPGSKVVTRYLQLAGLMPYLEALGFHLVGFGCTTCIGNSGPLRPEINQVIRENELLVASVLSGNRNFEGRIHQEVRANYLASPPLVVAFALAGNMYLDLTTEPVGYDPNGSPVYLKEIWPAQEEIQAIIEEKVSPELFKEEYGNFYTGNENWNTIGFEGGRTDLYPWDPASTYIRKPPFFEGLTREVPPSKPIESARVLAVLGDSITTDHISPAGAIAKESPAARWLIERGVKTEDFNTFGSRRGNHEVMIRGTFGNIRIRNSLVPGVEGGYTLSLPEGKEMSIFEAARRYAAEEVPLIVIAGKDYGMGSSRDWAAKGALLLGIKAVIAESFERIHRSNLVGMGVLPLQFEDSASAGSLGLTGRELFDVEPISQARQRLRVSVRGEKELEFTVLARIDSPIELEYYRNGGILHAVLRRLSR
jgi:aconitate hydratase